MLEDAQVGFPLLETLGLMHSELGHDDFRHLFFKIRTTMPKLRALAVSTDTVDYEPEGWDVFAALPPTVRDVYLEFDCCLDLLTRDSTKTADRIAAVLPKSATVHVLRHDAHAPIVVDWLDPATRRADVRQRARDAKSFGPWADGAPYVSRRGRGAAPAA